MYLRIIAIIFLLTFSVSCVYHDLTGPADCEHSGLSLLVDEIFPATDCSTADGSMVISVSGGALPYRYFLNDQVQTTNVFSHLPAGVYKVRVADAKGCEVSLENLTITATDFSFTAEVTGDNDCLGSNGSVAVVIEGGTPPFLFSNDGGEFTTNNIFTGLGAGEHIVHVKDHNNCILVLNISVPRESSGISWENDIQPIMTTYCATNGCHNGKSRQDLRLYDKAKFYADRIKSMTKDRSMPFEGSLTQGQIDLIGCWVDDGALNN